MSYKNNEGYPDPTAGKAVRSAGRMPTHIYNAFCVFPGMGEMFVARESGPELVGRMGNRSAVANNNQIIAGIRAGVFEAVVNAFESMQGRNDRGQELHIYLEGDAKKLFKVIRQEGNNYQKQTGNPVFG